MSSDEIAALPDFATHYYRTSRGPFRNLSDLRGDELRAVVIQLVAERDEGLHERSFGPTYVRMRMIGEERLRQYFADLGGRPERSAPHYFVLGESPWFRGLATDMAEIRIPLSMLPDDQTTVTWSDSFAATKIGPEFGLPHTPAPHHGKVFRLSDIETLFAAYGMPAVDEGLDYRTYLERGPDRFVEVQLWSDEPVRQYLDSRND
jgi:hypothetical protein